MCKEIGEGEGREVRVCKEIYRGGGGEGGESV